MNAETIEQNKETLGTVADKQHILHAIAVSLINGFEVLIILNSDTGSSCICTSLLTKLSEKPIRKGNRTVEHLYGTLKKKFEILKVRLQ